MVDDAKKKRDRTTFKPHYIATATGSIHVRRPWRGKDKSHRRKGNLQEHERRHNGHGGVETRPNYGGGYRM